MPVCPGMRVRLFSRPVWLTHMQARAGSIAADTSVLEAGLWEASGNGREEGKRDGEGGETEKGEGRGEGAREGTGAAGAGGGQGVESRLIVNDRAKRNGHLDNVTSTHPSQQVPGRIPGSGAGSSTELVGVVEVTVHRVLRAVMSLMPAGRPAVDAVAVFGFDEVRTERGSGMS